jgi:hypothetical protein
VPLPLTDLKPSARRTLYALRQAGQKGATTGELCQPEPQLEIGEAA